MEIKTDPTQILKNLEEEGIMISLREQIKKWSKGELKEKVKYWLGLELIRLQKENEELKKKVKITEELQRDVENLRSKLKDPLDEIFVIKHLV